MLTKRQIYSLAAYGAALWFAAALFIRFSPFGFDGTTELVLLYVITVPVSWAFFRGGVLIGRLGPLQYALGASVAVATAPLLDGVAQAWFPSLYGTSLAHVQWGAALLLWGIGAVVLIAFIEQQRHAA